MSCNKALNHTSHYDTKTLLWLWKVNVYFGIKLIWLCSYKSKRVCIIVLNNCGLWNSIVTWCRSEFINSSIYSGIPASNNNSMADCCAPAHYIILDRRHNTALPIPTPLFNEPSSDEKVKLFEKINLVIYVGLTRLARFLGWQSELYDIDFM